jgi:predicted GNAT family acetyltransferase
VTVAYDLMARSTGIALPPLAVPAGFETRRAGVEDEAALYPLQAAYEQEEVLTAIHRFDEAGCRAGLAKALREQVVLLGSLDGFIIAKAATNARAFGLDQLGGIYVAPPYRRRGIGAALVGRLVGTLAAEGRGAVLFVKSRNEAARHLYDGLGFHFAGPYRADYLVSGL